MPASGQSIGHFLRETVFRLSLSILSATGTHEVRADAALTLTGGRWGEQTARGARFPLESADASNTGAGYR
jgi:hypothetical protein